MQAIIIQKYIKGWLARRWYAKQSHRIVIVQSLIRKFLARRMYKKLRAEARSIEHVKKLNKGLENKIISLQQKIQEKDKEIGIIKHAQNEVIELKTKLETFKALEMELKRLNVTLTEKDKQILNLEESLKVERDEKMDLIEEQEKYKNASNEERRVWAEETGKLRKELDNMNEIVKMSEETTEQKLKTRIAEEKMMLISEQDQDRNAYQKLLQEYHCLEQHCESLEKEMNNRTRGSLGHVRNASDVSSIVDESMATASDITGDYGYGSVRSTTSTESSGHGRLESIEWQKGSGDGQNSSVSSDSQTSQITAAPQNSDISLVLKLQHKLAEVERENKRLLQRLDELDSSPTSERAETRAQDTYRINELEVTNSNLKKQLQELRHSIETGSQEKTLVDQFEKIQEELDRKCDEIIQLKAIIATQTANFKTITSATIAHNSLNEDGELVLAYDTQKKINKQLELELQDEKTNHKQREKEYKLEIEKLREDNERQQKLLSVNLTKSPASQTEAYMQHEIERLTSENLDLQERLDALADQLRMYKKQAKVMAKKLKDAGFLEAETEVTKTEQITAQQALVPITRKKDGGYLGMFEFQKGDETIIMKHLITDLKPRTAVTLLPGLPAYILFMCVRHTDYINDENKVRSLLTAFINGIKKVIKKRHEDFETSVLWMSNTLRMLHNLKQYSGDKAFQTHNTSKQNEQCLRYFDLSEYRQVLSDIAVWIYQSIIRSLEDKIHPLVIPAILEHEAISGIGGNKPAGMRGRSSSVCRDLESPVSVQKAPHTLLQELTNYHKVKHDVAIIIIFLLLFFLTK